MDFFHLIFVFWFIANRLISGKIYHCGNNSYNVTESSVWNCCAGKLFNMSTEYCSRNGPTSCLNSKVVKWCDNGHCLYHKWKCDGANDCRDGSDEFGCSSCTSTEYKCRNSICVDMHSVCDGENNCGDGSDEFGCPKIGNNGACRYDQFRCKNHSCVSMLSVCDTKDDCGDCSDEEGCNNVGVIAKRQKEDKAVSAECDYQIKQRSSAVLGGQSPLFPKWSLLLYVMSWILSTFLSGT